MPPRSMDCEHCNSVFSEFCRNRRSEEQRILAQAKRRRHFRAGQVLYDEGGPCENVYCIHTGRLKLYKFGANEEEVIIGLAGPRDMIGYLACVDGGPHDTSAETLTEVVACSIPSKILAKLVTGDTSSTRPILQRLFRDLRGAQNEIVSRTHTSAETRIARLLLWFLRGESAANGDAVLSLPMKRMEIAQMTGTTPETVSRVLHVLHENGVLNLSRRSIQVRKPEELGALAQASRSK